MIFSGNRVTAINWNATPYKSRNVSKQELVDILGPEEGAYEYEYAQKVRRNIEKAVRAAANAVYGSGTSQANSFI